jgi:hypothetical protein
MKGHDDADEDNTDTIAAHQRSEFRPVCDQDKARAKLQRLPADICGRMEERKMERVPFRLRPPRSTMRAARRLAKNDGVSLNQWIGAAVAEKVAAVETAAAFTGRSRGQIHVVADLLAPVNTDWNVSEDL